ncbi:uncharacterized protein LOC141911509 isoform X2 [Tubulanus polymorphus]|uniref:uncharacterized protein LOC141911509 isoform X2 n=1 Tax=Tubulanus polymorphus TaxID=672921 RepID=UPI003DA32E92
MDPKSGDIFRDSLQVFTSGLYDLTGSLNREFKMADADGSHGENLKHWKSRDSLDLLDDVADPSDGPSDTEGIYSDFKHRKAVTSSGYFSDWDTSFSEGDDDDDDDDDDEEDGEEPDFPDLETKLWFNSMKGLGGGSATIDGATNSMSASKLTPTLAIESFRASFILGGDGDGDQEVDLDAILGELCALETELKTQKSEINKSMQIPSVVPPPPVDDLAEQRQHDIDAYCNNQLEMGGQLPPAMTADGISSSSSSSRTRRTSGQQSGSGVTMERRMSALDDALEQMTMLGLNMVKGEQTVVTDDVAATPPAPPAQFTNIDSSMNKSHRDSVVDRDSAFMENESLRSSESFLSVNTTGSSSSSGAGGVSGPADGLVGGGATNSHLSSEYHSMESATFTAEEVEHAAKMKAEKIRIAMEKMKESNFRKLFVRAYTPDGSSKSILVDETMTVRKVWQILTDKNHWKPNVNLAVIEQLPALYMERILEDSDSIVDVMLTWTKDTSNKVLFTEKPIKYNVFQNPERYLLGESYSERGSALDDHSRRKLVDEFFAVNQIPEVEGMLYLKAEGKKAWKKIYCVLRASGIYCNPKGKSKSLKDLTSLVQLDMVEVYHGVGWKKKYKAPTDYCFALKHPKIQKKAIKYIKYLCAEDKSTYLQWMTGIRIAKLGQKLYQNYKDLCSDVALWESNVLPSIGQLASDRLTMLCVATPPKTTPTPAATKPESGRRGSLPSSTVNKVEQTPSRPVQRRASVATHDVGSSRRTGSTSSGGAACARSMSFAHAGDVNRNSVCGGSSTDSSNSADSYSQGGGAVSRKLSCDAYDPDSPRHNVDEVYSTLTRRVERVDYDSSNYGTITKRNLAERDAGSDYGTVTRRNLAERDASSDYGTITRHSRVGSESNFSLRSSMRGGVRAKANLPVTTDVTKYLTLGRRGTTPPNELEPDYLLDNSDYSTNTCDQSANVIDGAHRYFAARQSSPAPPPGDFGVATNNNALSQQMTTSDSSTMTPSPPHENISEDSGIASLYDTKGAIYQQQQKQQQQQQQPMVQTHSRESSMSSQTSSIRSRPHSGSSYSSGHSAETTPPTPQTPNFTRPVAPPPAPPLPNNMRGSGSPAPSSQQQRTSMRSLNTSVENVGASSGLPFLSELVTRSSHSELGPKSLLKPPPSATGGREHRRAASHGSGGGVQQSSNHAATIHSTSDSQLSSHGTKTAGPVTSPKPRCKPPPPPRTTPVMESDYVQDVLVQAPSAVRNTAADGLPLPPAPDFDEGLCDIDSLPPPPPELLEGLPGYDATPAPPPTMMQTPPSGKKKPPPPPPKRRDSSQAPKDYV